ncbi:dTDP-glucose 4,6-dehydratase [Clostridium algidicarnis]|uniref:dTDP-glucose 4,6-dehydratase n=1 Tax=Clostridium algidicarnis TaxID=37659 RepID=UPI003FD838DA
MKNYLVTGGAGFIGSNFIAYILNKYKDIYIINLDSLTYAGNMENLKSVESHNNYKFIQGDICDKGLVEDIFNEYDIDYVVNFAAESHVDRSIKNPDVFVKTNVMGTLNLLNVSKNAWADGEGFKSGKKFIQISTDEVYGSLGDTGFFKEDTPLDPHSPYSASKTSADLMVKSYFDTYKMPINITRCSNNYGPYQFPEKLIPLIINNCLNNKPIPVYGDGLNVRDWLYVEDHCSAIDMVVRRGISGEVYNIGGHNEKTNMDIINNIIEYLNKNVDDLISKNLITYVDDRKGHDKRYGIDPTKIKEELGWYPKTSFEEGIIKTIDWYLGNKQWMDNITMGSYQEYYKKMYNK